MAQRGNRKYMQATLEDSRKDKRRKRIGGEMGMQKEPEPEPEGRGRTGWVVGMLGRRQEMPRWVNDLVWQMEVLGWRRGCPGGRINSCDRYCRN